MTSYFKLVKLEWDPKTESFDKETAHKGPMPLAAALSFADALHRGERYMWNITEYVPNPTREGGEERVGACSVEEFAILREVPSL